jgi:hypothetical protein
MGFQLCFTLSKGSVLNVRMTCKWTTCLERVETQAHRIDQHSNRVSQKRTPNSASFVSCLLHSRTVQLRCTGVPNTHVRTSRFKRGGIYMYQLLQEQSEQFSYAPHLYVSYNYRYKYPLLPYTVLTFGLPNRHALHFLWGTDWMLSAVQMKVRLQRPRHVSLYYTEWFFRH